MSKKEICKTIDQYVQVSMILNNLNCILYINSRNKKKEIQNSKIRLTEILFTKHGIQNFRNNSANVSCIILNQNLSSLNISYRQTGIEQSLEKGIIYDYSRFANNIYQHPTGHFD